MTATRDDTLAQVSEKIGVSIKHVAKWQNLVGAYVYTISPTRGVPFHIVGTAAFANERKAWLAFLEANQPGFKRMLQASWDDIVATLATVWEDRGAP